ncbi:MAG: hypothetical protein ACM30E_03480 [Nitrososphaerales archaeon]
MEPLTFSIGGEADSEAELILLACPECDLTEVMWKELAAHIAVQRTQIPCPAAILAQRCREGYAAVAVSEGHIAAYTSLSPVAEGACGAHGWTAITAGLRISEGALPRARVYEFASSWTDPAWRCKHINMTLRLLLVERYLRDRARPDGLGRGGALGMGGMIGLTSSTLARLGCRILGWNVAPFITSLIAAPAKDFPAEAAAGWRPPQRLRLYQGPHVPLDDPVHHWQEFIHCWVTDIDLAVALDCEFSSLMHGDLRGWRSAIVAAFTKPDSLHRLAFLT